MGNKPTWMKIVKEKNVRMGILYFFKYQGSGMTHKGGFNVKFQFSLAECFTKNSERKSVENIQFHRIFYQGAK